MKKDGKWDKENKNYTTAIPNYEEYQKYQVSNNIVAPNVTKYGAQSICCGIKWNLCTTRTHFNTTSYHMDAASRMKFFPPQTPLACGKGPKLGFRYLSAKTQAAPCTPTTSTYHILDTLYSTGQTEMYGKQALQTLGFTIRIRSYLAHLLTHTHCTAGSLTPSFGAAFCTKSVQLGRNPHSFGESLYCALLLDYVSPQAHPLETPLEFGDPNWPSSRKLQTTFPSHNTHHAHGKAMNSALVATLNNTQLSFCSIVQ